RRGRSAMAGGRGNDPPLGRLRLGRGVPHPGRPPQVPRVRHPRDSPRRPAVTASAVLRVGSHAPVPLHGTPVADPGCKPGETGIILGYTALHEPVTIVTGSLEWDDDLLEA